MVLLLVLCQHKNIRLPISAAPRTMLAAVHRPLRKIDGIPEALFSYTKRHSLDCQDRYARRDELGKFQ